MTSQDPKDPRLNWGALSQAERDAAYDNNKAVANSPALIAARNEASAKFSCGPRRRAGYSLRGSRANKDRSLSLPRQVGTLSGLHPRRILATQFARCLCHAGRRNGRARMVGRDTRLFAGARGGPDRDRPGDIARAGLAGGERSVAGHRRSRYLIRMVRRRPSHRARAGSSRGDGRAGRVRCVRSGADPRHRAERGAEAYRSGSRKTIAAAAPDRAKTSRDRLRCGRIASAGIGTPGIFTPRARPRARPATSSRSKAPTISPSWSSCASRTGH